MHLRTPTPDQAALLAPHLPAPHSVREGIQRSRFVSADGGRDDNVMHVLFPESG
jgi:hypothetical protein